MLQQYLMQQEDIVLGCDGFMNLFPEATTASFFEEMRQSMIVESISDFLLVSVVTNRLSR